MTRWWHEVSGWPHFGLYLILVVTLVLHFSIIMQPRDLVFDEQHYVKNARVILAQNTDERPEHPPLSKLFITAGVAVFGDNPIGWRLPSVIFGTILIILFYFLCLSLGMSGEATLLATFLFSLDNLTFVQASVAMLDVFMLTFMMGSFLLYVNRRYFSAGIALALSALGKLYGALAGPAIFLHWLLTRRGRVEYILMTIIAAPATFLALLPVFDFIIWRQWLEPIGQIKNMLSLSGSLTFTGSPSDQLSRPWDWVLRPQILYYWYDPHYIGAISFTVWILIIPAVLYMVWRAFRRDNAAIFGLCWFLGTYLVWIPLNIVTDRISFIFYFYPTVGAVCIGIALGLSRLIDFWRSRQGSKLGKAALSVVGLYLAGHVVVFFVLAPVFSKWLPFSHVF